MNTVLFVNTSMFFLKKPSLVLTVPFLSFVFGHFLGPWSHSQAWQLLGSTFLAVRPIFLFYLQVLLFLFEYLSNPENHKKAILRPKLNN